MAALPVNQPPAASDTVPCAPRRGFFAKFSAAVLGGIVVVCPFAAGAVAFLDPIRKSRRGGSKEFVRVAPAAAVPTDGTPVRFQVIDVRHDAWNKYPPAPIGGVYLRRKTDGTIEAFNEVCPHLGCVVSFVPQRDIYQCPCHTSAFDGKDGHVLGGPSPRGLDTLTCEVREEGGVPEVWVKFENFYTGRTEKTPKG